MYKVERKTIIESVKGMLLESVKTLDKEVLDAFENARENERNPLAKNILDKILENHEIANSKDIPLCQDTGIVVCFLEIGRELYFDYDLDEAINVGVSQAYIEGYLRKSIVRHPLNRINTMDNTPAVIHHEFIPGNKLIIHIAPKGGGSENMSTLKMLSPSEGREGLIQFVLDTITKGGGRPCPPLIVGVGIGGNFEKCAWLAKKAILRPLGDVTENPVDRELEIELMERINKLDVGPMGLGGDATCIGVKVNSFPCHIASLPVAVNLQCHSARKSEVTLIGKEINHTNN
ncbi:MAG: fumarate hydratase [Candidatus Izemoplasmatales bacterium]|nr:fumarate hydratase [Candidatus Izemoplasmatales bacterium]